jgi:hypothetical protein
MDEEMRGAQRDGTCGAGKKRDGGAGAVSIIGRSSRNAALTGDAAVHQEFRQSDLQLLLNIRLP